MIEKYVGLMFIDITIICNAYLEVVFGSGTTSPKERIKKHSVIALINTANCRISGQRKAKIANRDQLFAICGKTNYTSVKYDIEHFAVLICKIHGMTERSMIRDPA